MSWRKLVPIYPLPSNRQEDFFLYPTPQYILYIIIPFQFLFISTGLMGRREVSYCLPLHFLNYKWNETHIVCQYFFLRDDASLSHFSVGLFSFFWLEMILVKAYCYDFCPCLCNQTIFIDLKCQFSFLLYSKHLTRLQP